MIYVKKNIDEKRIIEIEESDYTWNGSVLRISRNGKDYIVAITDDEILKAIYSSIDKFLFEKEKQS